MDYVYVRNNIVTPDIVTLPVYENHLYNGYNRSTNLASTAVHYVESDYVDLCNVLADGAERFGVSCVTFDDFENLIWMGNEGGHVSSYCGTSMQKYTSFQVHSTEMVRQINTIESGILALTPTTLRSQIRRGLPKFTYKSEHMGNMLCMLELQKNRLILGGHQDKIVDLDLETLTERNLISTHEKGCAILRSHSRYLCAGDAFGTIKLINPNTLQVEHRLDSHTGSLSDFDVQGNYLVSCGFSTAAVGRNGSGSNSDTMNVDCFLNVYDLRMVRPMSRIHVIIEPILLRFIPTSNLRLSVVSAMGQVQFVDSISLSNPTISLTQVNTNGCLSFDISSTSQALVFGDQSGRINLIGEANSSQIKFNNFSNEPEFADISSALPFVSIDNKEFPVSSIQLPNVNADSKWLSDFPKQLVEYRYRRYKPPDPDITSNLKMQGPIGYAPNTKHLKRNLVPYIVDSGLSNNQNTSPINNVSKGNTTDSSDIFIPKKYRKIDVKYTKLGAQEFDFEQYNQTKFTGLEATLPNAYCNAMLQVLYFTKPLRQTLLTHTCTREFCLTCELGFLFQMLDKSTADAPCQASNFLRSFRTVPEAAALDLILLEHNPHKSVNFISLIQNWNRFILHQIHNELLESRKRDKTMLNLITSNEMLEPQFQNDIGGFVDMGTMTDSVMEDVFQFINISAKPEPVQQNNENEETEISKLFGTNQKHTQRCLTCGEENIKNTNLFVCNLLIPQALRDAERISFQQVLQRSLSLEQSIPAFCDKCNKFTRTIQSATLTDLPKILSINCGLTNEKELNFLKNQMSKNTSSHSESLSTNNTPSKPCRYGLSCSRTDCHFSHTDRNSASSTSSASSSVPLASPLRPLRTNSWFPLNFTMEIDANEKLDVHLSNLDLVTDFNRLSCSDEEQSSDSNSNSINLNNGDSGSIPAAHLSNKQMKKSIDYNLTAVVCEINEGTQKNLVSLIYVPNSYHELKNDTTKDGGQWYVFNDFSITPVSVKESVWFTLDWKIPCVLYYTSTEIMNNDECTTMCNPVNPFTYDILHDNISPNRSNLPFTPLGMDEMPKAGDIIAMDAEFVTLNSEESEIGPDGRTTTIKPSHQSVARISCIRGQGPLEGVPFMDDYISTPQVADYLTKFSGIKPGDLDANYSDKHLKTLKSNYQKLRYLVERGVIFVGHGLKNDFRVINIIVPPNQIIDTVNLFKLPNHRLVSLKFLAWHFLGIRIQLDEHDSIEDACAALELYKYYLKLTENERLSALVGLYDKGKELSWKVPNEE